MKHATDRHNIPRFSLRNSDPGSGSGLQDVILRRSRAASSLALVALTCCFPSALRGDNSLATGVSETDKKGENRFSLKNVDKFVEREMCRLRVPGLSLAILKNGSLIYVKAYGVANLEHNVPTTTQTVFQTGSVGKQFAAAGILLLADDGLLHLDDPVSKFFPNAPAAWADITVRHLLGHTSGIPDYYSGEPNKDVLNPRLDYTEEQIVEGLGRPPLQFRPGQGWQYSNSGYILLGFIIHRVSGQDYGDFLRDRIFVPAGMTSTRVISNTDIIPHRAAGYELTEGGLKNASDWAAPSLGTTADGCMYTTIEDLARWDAALYRDSPLSRSTRALMWTPAQFAGGKRLAINNWGGAGYNAGWQIDNYWGHPVVEHSGMSQGFTAHLSRYLDHKVTVIILQNRIGVPAREMAHGVVMRAYPELRPVVIPDPDPNFTRRFLETLEAAHAGKLQADQFNFKYFGDSVPAEWYSELSATMRHFGAVKTAAPIEIKDEDGILRRRYRVDCEKGAVLSTVLVQSDGKIGWINAWPE